MIILSLLFAITLSLIHLFSYKIKFLQVTPRSIWLSFAGGASVSYIFIYLLPELAVGQELFIDLNFPFLDYLSNHIYIISLLGLCVFYGLERYINIIKGKNPGKEISRADFLLHILAFSFYNFMIGYLLLQSEGKSILNSTFFFVAMAFHILVNDYGLNQHHKNLYIHKGRWILSFSVLLGWVIGFLTSISSFILLSILAFLSGGIILNVLKEELPEDRRSNFWAFLSGVLFFYVILLLAS
jgi:hypothetical protein